MPPFHFFAEWEYEPVFKLNEEEIESTLERLSSPTGDLSSSMKPSANSNTFPSARVGAGTWLDANGFWWLFGGQGPSPQIQDEDNSSSSSSSHVKSIQFLGDLWKYGPLSSSHSRWEPIYNPREATDESFMSSSYPDNLGFPLLCGSDQYKHLGLFGGPNSPGNEVSTESNNVIHGQFESAEQKLADSSFMEDNAVWLFDIPTVLEENGTKKEECDGTQGMECKRPSGAGWTSYVCCDACLPDEEVNEASNGGFEFCPKFSREPILWCGQDAIMVLQLEHKAHHGQESEVNENSLNQVEQTDSLESVGDAEAVKRLKEVKKGTLKRKKTMVYRERKKFKEGMGINKDRNNEKKGRATSNALLGVVTWWKFDLRSREWMKMPEVRAEKKMGKVKVEESLSADDLSSLTPSCRNVSPGHKDSVYILCPTKDPVERLVFHFEPKKSTLKRLGRIRLNNAFRDKRAWELGRSVLHAQSNEDSGTQTVILLAYHKLLDLWIHDHESQKLFPVENVWKGSSLHAFQHTNSFYKLTLALSSGGTPLPPNSQANNGTNTQKPLVSYTSKFSFYMANPRSKLFSFDDHRETGRFLITIVTDKAVFLPARDAPAIPIDMSAEISSKPFIPDSIETLDLSKSHPSHIPDTTNSFPKAPLIISPTQPALKSHSFLQELTSPQPANAIDSPSKSISLEASNTTKRRAVQAKKTSTQVKSKFNLVTESPVEIRLVKKANREIATQTNSANTSYLSKQDETTLTLSEYKVAKTKFPDANQLSSAEVIMKSSEEKFSTNGDTQGTTSNGKSPLVYRHGSLLATPYEGDIMRRELSSISTSKEVGAATLESLLPTIHQINGDNEKSLRNKGDEESQQSLTNHDGADETRETFINSSTSGIRITNTTTTTGTLVSSKSSSSSGGGDLNEANNDDSSSMWKSELKSEKELKMGSLERHPVSHLIANRKSAVHPSERSWKESKTYSSRADGGSSVGIEEIATSPRTPLLLPVQETRLSSSGDKDDSMATQIPRSTPVNEIIGRGASVGETDVLTGPLTYRTSMEIIAEPQAQADFQPKNYAVPYPNYSSIIFFSVSLSIFASIAIVMFVKRCVKCPPPTQNNVLLRETPPISYSVMSDDFPIEIERY